MDRRAAIYGLVLPLLLFGITENSSYVFFDDTFIAGDLISIDETNLVLKCEGSEIIVPLANISIGFLGPVGTIKGGKIED